VANDLMAIGALRVLRAAGRRVPDEWPWSLRHIELAQHTEPIPDHRPPADAQQALTMTEPLLAQINGEPIGDPSSSPPSSSPATPAKPVPWIGRDRTSRVGRTAMKDPPVVE